MGRKRKPRRTANGDGAFRMRDNGTIEYRVTFKDEFGMSGRKSFSGDTEEECLEKYELFLRKMDKKLRGIDIDATIPDIVREKYRNDLALNYVGEQGYSRNISTLKIMENHPIGNLPITEVTEGHIIIFLSSITHYSNSVIQKLFQQLKMAFEIACDKKIITVNLMTKNSMRRPKSSKEDKKVHGFTSEEQQLFLDAMMSHNVPENRNDYRKQLLIELYTGMRMGEINALRPEDVDLERRIIHVRRTISRGVEYQTMIKDGTKTKAGKRDIPITKQAEKVLRDAIDEMKRNPEGLIFYDYNKNEPIQTSQVNCFFRRICEKAGVSVRGQHALRHTFATRCIESGIPPVVLKKWLGHTNIHITLDTYADVFDKMNNDAIDKFEEYMDTII